MKVLIAGDFCPRGEVAEAFEGGGFEKVLGEVKPFFSLSDYSLVNFECPVTDGSANPIVKQGVNLYCSKSGIDAVKWLGCNCVTLANNHFYDYGDNGVAKTLQACKEYGIDYVGGGMSLEDVAWGYECYQNALKNNIGVKLNLWDTPELMK